MKIKELIKRINETTTVSAKLIGAEIVFFGLGKQFYTMDYFLSVPVDARVWDTIEFDPDSLDDVIPQDLARTMDVIQQLLNTPVKDRFPKKHYRVRLRGFNSDGGHQYLTVSTRYSTNNLGSVFAAAWNTGLKQTFTADELNKIRERFKGSKWIVSMLNDGVEEVGE